MEKYVGRELERRRYFEIGNFKKKKRLGTCSGTEVEVTLNNDLFLREDLEEWLDTASGCLGKPET